MAEKSPIPSYRVLMIAPAFSKPGGVADYCKMLMDHLGPSFRATQVTVGGPAGGGLLGKAAALQRSWQALRLALKKGTFDIVHLNPSFKVNSLLRDSLLLCWIIAARAGKKTVVLFHGWDPLLFSRIDSSRLLRTIVSSILKRAALVIVLFGEARQKLVGWGLALQKIAVTTTMFEGSKAPRSAREPVDPGRTPTIGILFMSRLLREKGTLIAAEVVRRLAQSTTRPFSAVFAGDGPDRPELRAFLEKHGLAARVDMPGFVSGETKQRLFEASDILLFPTYYGEGCPVVVLEAMGAGLAIVSTAVGAIPDVVTDGENGIIVGNRDPVDFLNATLRLLEDEPLLRRIQLANIRKARELFEANVVTRNIESHYLSVIHGR